MLGQYNRSGKYRYWSSSVGRVSRLLMEIRLWWGSSVYFSSVPGSLVLRTDQNRRCVACLSTERMLERQLGDIGVNGGRVKVIG